VNYTTDYNPTADYNPAAERSGVYASLNREKLGAKTRQSEQSPTVYAELNSSAMSAPQKDAYV